MPNDNEYGGQQSNAIGNAVGFLTPWYAFSSLHMMSRMPTEGLKVPWTPITLWSPGERLGRVAEKYNAQRFTKGGRLPLLRARQSGRIATRTLYSGQLAARRATGKALTSASRTFMKMTSKISAKGLSARFLVGKLGGYGIAAVLTADALALGWMATGGLYGGISKAVSKYKGLEMGGYFPDTQTAMTSRQRAVQAITTSQLQARSAIGNEAMLFHR